MRTNLRRSALVMSMCVLLGGTLYGCASTAEHPSTGQYIDDAAITTKVKTKLLGDSITEGLKVHVETNHGVVELSGFVKTAEQRAQAGKLAQGVPGVKAVRNGLVVK
ncbi:MAG: BON domain-containing protein [Gammaproteobacteria bacterium]